MTVAPPPVGPQRTGINNSDVQAVMRIIGYNLLPFDAVKQSTVHVALDVALPDIASQARALHPDLEPPATSHTLRSVLHCAAACTLERRARIDEGARR